MTEDELVDAELEKDFFSIFSRYKYALIIFALLDGVSLLRSYQEVRYYFEFGTGYSEFSIFRLLIIASFAISAVLFILRKKEAFVLYYVQFSLRILFMMLSFGFLIELFGGLYGSTAYWTMIVLVFVLEIVRLIQTIIIHRKMNKFSNH